MLRKLRVENFFSIGPMVELDLSVAKNAPQDDRYARPDPSKDERFAKVAVLYGPNASGKTNVLRAAAFVMELMTDSFRWQPDGRFPFVPCKTVSFSGATSKFEIEFDVYTKEVGRVERFIYRAEITRNEVIYESMCRFGKRRKMLFERTGNNVKYGPDYCVNITLKKNITIPSYASVISTLASYQHLPSIVISAVIRDFFSNVGYEGKKKRSYIPICRLIKENPNTHDEIKNEMNKFDIDINEIKIIERDGNIDAKFIHDSVPDGVNRIFESEGTVNLFTILPYINLVLDSGSIAFIDELDGDLHPSVVAEIVRRFTSSENKHNAQLVMTCHNPALLRHLSKDEVHIVEKDADHFTRITALKNMAGVRRDGNLETQYLGGAFGGLPLLA
ncbi:MAG TPA: AAA family ATPase [Azospirillaceae bacterium]|nr:AAA family ATPase [Azospirillaceae bacterium]HRQ80454.1 AAA family ATPase [Azospirillaceae bacterium]